MSYFTLIKWKRENCKFFLSKLERSLRPAAAITSQLAAHSRNDMRVTFVVPSDIPTMKLAAPAYQRNKVICDDLKRYFKNLYQLGLYMFISLLVFVKFLLLLSMKNSFLLHPKFYVWQGGFFSPPQKLSVNDPKVIHKCAKKGCDKQIVGYFLARVYYFMDGFCFWSQLCKKQTLEIF